MDRSRRGLVVILVTGILGLLAAVAVGTHFTADLSKKLSRHTLWQARARLMARSGLEHALVDIAADPFGHHSRRGRLGNIHTVNGSGVVNETYRIAVKSPSTINLNDDDRWDGNETSGDGGGSTAGPVGIGSTRPAPDLASAATAPSSALEKFLDSLADAWKFRETQVNRCRLDGPALADSFTGDTRFERTGSLGRFLLDRRPAAGFSATDRLRVETWLHDYAKGEQLPDPDRFSREISDLLTLGPAAEPFRAAFIPDDETERNWHRGRVDHLVRPAVDLNTAPVLVLTALIDLLPDPEIMQHRPVPGVSDARQDDAEQIRISVIDPDRLSGRGRVLTRLENMGATEFDYGLYSMAESQLLAEHLDSARQASALGTWERVRDALITFRNGRDSCLWNGPAMDELLSETFDDLTGNERAGLAWVFLNPRAPLSTSWGGTGARLDEIQPWWRRREIQADRLSLDLSSIPHVRLFSGLEKIRSEGVVSTKTTVYGRIACESLVRGFDVLSVESQRDFEEALDDNSGFVTLPVIDADVEASEVVGELVLEPRAPDMSLAGLGPLTCLRMSGCPYTDPDRATSVRAGASGVRNLPGAPASGWPIRPGSPGNYGMSAWPRAGFPAGSLSGSGTSGQPTHLVPGGGLRTPAHLQGATAGGVRYHDSRIALPMTTDVDRDISDGVVSMLVRPAPRPQGSNSRDWTGANVETLFCHELKVQDPEILTSLMEPQQFHMQIRCLQGNVSPAPSAEIRHFPKSEPALTSSGGERIFESVQGHLGDWRPGGGEAHWRLWVEVKLTPVTGVRGSPSTHVLRTGLSSRDGTPYAVSKTFALDCPSITPTENPFAPGRWHHVVVAWHNLTRMLAFDSPHQGGQIAVWHNGVLKGRCGDHAYDGQFWSTHVQPHDPDAIVRTTPSINLWIPGIPEFDDPAEAIRRFLRRNEIGRSMQANLDEALAGRRGYQVVRGGEIDIVIRDQRGNELGRQGENNLTEEFLNWLKIAGDNRWNVSIEIWIDRDPSGNGTETVRLIEIPIGLLQMSTRLVGGYLDPDIRFSDSEITRGTTLMDLKPKPSRVPASIDYHSYANLLFTGSNPANLTAYGDIRAGRMHLGYTPFPEFGSGTIFPGSINSNLTGASVFMDIAVLNRPGPGLVDPSAPNRFRPAISGYEYSAYGDLHDAPVSASLVLARDRREPFEVLAVAWDAELPEFHSWDLQGPIPDRRQQAWDFLMSQLDPESLRSEWEQWWSRSHPTFRNILEKVEDTEFDDSFVSFYFGNRRLHGPEDLPTQWGRGRIQIRFGGMYRDLLGGDPILIHDAGRSRRTIPEYDMGDPAPAVPGEKDDLWIEMRFKGKRDVLLSKSHWSGRDDRDIHRLAKPQRIASGGVELVLECLAGPDRSRANSTPRIYGIDVFRRGIDGPTTGSLLWE